VISDKQHAASLRSAQLSTGPRTEEGKASSGWNALKHGLPAQVWRASLQAPGAFDTLCARLAGFHQPANITREFYVERMAFDEAQLALFSQCRQPLQPFLDQAPIPRSISSPATRCAFRNLMLLRTLEEPTVPNEPSPIFGHQPSGEKGEDE